MISTMIWSGIQHKVDKKAMIRNRYNRIPHPISNTTSMLTVFLVLLYYWLLKQIAGRFIISEYTYRSRKPLVQSILLKKRFTRINEETVKITSAFSILIALIDNFDVRFVEICLVFLIFFFFQFNLKTISYFIFFQRCAKVFVAVAQGFSLRFARERTQDRSSPS